MASMIFRQPANQPKEITNASGTSDCKIKFINERLSEYRRAASLLRVGSQCSIDSKESQVTFLNNIARATLSVKIASWRRPPGHHMVKRSGILNPNLPCRPVPVKIPGRSIKIKLQQRYEKRHGCLSKPLRIKALCASVTLDFRCDSSSQFPGLKVTIEVNYPRA